MMFLNMAATSLLLCLMWRDLTRRQLQNKLVGGYALIFMLLAVMAGTGPAAWWGHLWVAGLGFLFFFILFVLGTMGGGDVKLGAAVMLWAGPGLALSVVLIITWVGGLVAILGWLADRRLVRRAGLACRPLHQLRRALSAQRGVPYGVALAAGGLYAIWHEIRF